MAFSAGEIEAILTLRDRMTKQLQGAAGAMTRFGTTLTRVGNQARQAGVGLTAGLTVPIVGLAAAAAKSFATFEKGMNRVAAVTGATGQDFDSLSDKAKELGATTVFSASQAADAMAAFGLAGFEVNEILDVMTGTLNLAAAAQLQVGEAAAITAKVLRGYGIDVSETARVTDVLTKAFTTSNTDLVQLGDAFRSAGPVARSAGIEFEETAAALSLMADAGFQGTLGGTALRGALARLLSPTKQAADILKEMGVNTTDATGRLLPLDQIIQQLEPHAEDTGKIMQLFGLRAGPAMAALINQGSDALRAQTAALVDAGGTAEAISDIQLRGLAGAFVLFRSAAEGAFISIGEQLAPALRQLLASLRSLAGFVQNTVVPAFTLLPKGLQTTILAVTALLAIVGPLLAVFGLIATSIGALLPLLAGLATAVATASAALGAMSAIAIGINVALGAAVIAFGALAILVGQKLGVFETIRNSFAGWRADIESLTLELGGLTEKQVENFRINKAMADGLRGTITEANKLKAQLSTIGLAGTMDQLVLVFENFNRTGAISKESMQLIADRALELEAAGERIPPTLVALIDQLKTMAEAARELGDAQKAARLAGEMATAEFLAQQETLKDLGFLTLPDVIEKLDELVGLQEAAERSGFPAAEAALALMGEYETLAAAAEKSGINVERLNAALAANRQAAADALPVLQSTALNVGNIGVLVEGVTSEQVRAAREARELEEALVRTGSEARKVLTDRRIQAERDLALITASHTASAADIEAAQKALTLAQRRELGLSTREMRQAAGAGTQAFDLMATAIEGSFAQMLIGSKGFKEGFIDIFESIKRSLVNIFGSIVNLFLRRFLGQMLTGIRGAQPGFRDALAGLFGGGPGARGVQQIAGAAVAGPGAAGGLPGGGAEAAARASALPGIALSAGAGLALGSLGQRIFGPGKKAAGFGAATGFATGAALGSIVPGIGTLVGGAIGGLTGFFRGLFGGGPSKEELAESRKIVEDFTRSTIGLLTREQRFAAGGDAFRATLFAVQDAYRLIGRGGALRDVQTLREALRKKPDFARDIVRKISSGLQQAQFTAFERAAGIPRLSARHGIEGDFGQGTAVMLHGRERVTPLDEMEPQMVFNFNITAFDPTGLRKTVEDEIIPMIADAARGNRLQARTKLRTGLGVT